jgi:hypothetical protein
VRWLIAALALSLAACGGGGSSLPRGSESVKLDPKDFTSHIDNPYWPMAPGSRWVYRETDAEGNVSRVEVTVTSKAKRILGIDALVVHDVLTEDGDVKEDTYDWYAQDGDGNVWYLGEDTKEFDTGKVSTEGSWEAGVDGAQPGVLVPADPKPGLTYRQEYYEGQAEDSAEVLRLDAKATVPFGAYDGLLQTKEFTPLEPKLVEQKFYARGVGPVFARTVSGGSDREVLLRFERTP